jgi:hypothetical protein
MMDEQAVLKQIPLFSTMDNAEIAGIRAIMNLSAYAADEVILFDSDSGDAFCVVAQGHVQFAIQDADGSEIIVDEVGPGGFFGELAMLTGVPRAARGTPLDDVIMLALDRSRRRSALVWDVCYTEHIHSRTPLTHALLIRVTYSITSPGACVAPKRFAIATATMGRMGFLQIADSDCRFRNIRLAGRMPASLAMQARDTCAPVVIKDQNVRPARVRGR